MTFAPGQTEASFSIPIHDNPTEEAPEHFKVGLKTGANAWIDRTPAQVTIMDGCETDGWERVAWPTPFNGAYHRPVALDFAAPDDGWMVGNYWDEANSTARPLVHHYDGTGWQVVSLGDIRAQLTSVLAFGPNDVWTAGMDGSAIHAVVLHYDGISWTAFSPVPPAERAYSIDSFAGTGDNDLWVLGFLRDIGWDPDSYRILLHWDGASWKTFYLGSSGFEYYAVRSTGPGQAALIGTYYNRYSSDYINAMITTYDANGQTGGNMDNAYGYDRYLVTADLAPNGELFAVGRQYDDYLFTTEEPLIVRSFAGGNLNAVTTPYTYFYNNWVYDQSPMHNDTTYLNSVRAFTENDVWAVGETRAYSTGETTPVMLHYDGNVWDRVNAPAAFASMDRGGGVMWALDRSGGLYRLSALRQCAATIVTAAGGTITSGRATVTVPPNAVNDTIFMTLQPVLEPSQPLPDGQTLVTGAVVAVNDALGNPLGQIATNLGLSFNLFGLGSGVSALAEEPPVISILRREGAEWKMTCTSCPVSAEGVVSVQTDRTGEFVVVKGPAGEPPAGTATVSLSNLAQVYDGEPRPVSASTNPPGLSVAITYNGSSIPPTEAGTYTVSAVVTEANYEGSTSGELLIAKAPTTTLLQAPRVAGLGRSVTLTALVSPTGNLTGIIHGTVTFFDGAQVLGMVELSNTTNGFEAVLTVSDLALGAHNLTARYEESDNIAGSTSATGMLAVLPNALYLPVVSK